jgi:hypothetical protein
MMIKASQTNDLPYLGEPLGRFWERMVQQRVSGAKWSLFDYCVPRFGLADDLDPDFRDIHRADIAINAARLLFEKLRRFAEEW